MRDGKKCASQSVHNRKCTSKVYTTKKAPPTTTLTTTGTLDETTASSPIVKPTTIPGRNKCPALSRFNRDQRHLKKEKQVYQMWRQPPHYPQIYS